jgi:hypothetical protein
MPKLRTLAAVLASALCAAGVSVGAALAQAPPGHAPHGPGKAAAPPGLCFLHKL